MLFCELNSESGPEDDVPPVEERSCEAGSAAELAPPAAASTWESTLLVAESTDDEPPEPLPPVGWKVVGSMPLLVSTCTSAL